MEAESRYSSYAGPYRLLHWGPVIAILIILWISTFTVYCDLMYWPTHQKGGTINLVSFLLWTFLVLYNHYKASTVGPGFVSYKWQPKREKDKTHLQFCTVCQGYKAPRSHHCRKCNRCVMKMDHHCPWINTCCGHMNHGSFVYFLFFAPIGCIHGSFILIMSFYHGLNLGYYQRFGDGTEPLVRFTLFTLVGTMLAIGLAIGVTLSVGMLFIFQLKSIIRNKSGIEEWIIQKAEGRDRDDEFKYPYDLGCLQNIQQVFTVSGWPKSDGYFWDVREGCGQFDLTREQILQKEEKKKRAIEYSVVQPYSGRFFPITHGLCVCCCFPWSDEERIKLFKAETVTVTRWRKYWMYGEKCIEKTISDGHVTRRERGWFPRHCVVEIVGNGDSFAGGDQITNKSNKSKRKAE